MTLRSLAISMLIAGIGLGTNRGTHGDPAGARYAWASRRARSQPEFWPRTGRAGDQPARAKRRGAAHQAVWIGRHPAEHAAHDHHVGPGSAEGHAREGRGSSHAARRRGQVGERERDRQRRSRDRNAASAADVDPCQSAGVGLQLAERGPAGQIPAPDESRTGRPRTRARPRSASAPSWPAAAADCAAVGRHLNLVSAFTFSNQLKTMGQ